jgi:hypothetical protein
MRSGMLDHLKRYQGLSAGAGMCNGLRVRMGVVTGVVDGPAEAGAALANIMSSSLYQLALGGWYSFVACLSCSLVFHVYDFVM